MLQALLPYVHTPSQTPKGKLNYFLCLQLLLKAKRSQLGIDHHPTKFSPAPPSILLGTCHGQARARSWLTILNGRNAFGTIGRCAAAKLD